MKLNSSDLKTLALCWLRFGRQMELVATEAGHWNADVYGMTDNETVEIEVKVSKQDLKVDSQKPKHNYFRRCSTADTHSIVPNRFFFLVPESLEDAALEEAVKINPCYGVLVAKNEINYGDYHAHKMLKCARKAKAMHENKPSVRARLALIRRMSSELCGWYLSGGFTKHMIQAIKGLENEQDINAWEIAGKEMMEAPVLNLNQH